MDPSVAYALLSAAVVSAAAGAAVVSVVFPPPEHAVVATMAAAIVSANIRFFITCTFLSLFNTGYPVLITPLSPI